MEKNKIYSEAKQIRADTSILFGLKMIEKSGLNAGVNVRIETEIGSGRIVIARLKEEGS